MNFTRPRLTAPSFSDATIKSLAFLLSRRRTHSSLVRLDRLPLLTCTVPLLILAFKRVNRGDSQYVRVNLKELYIGNDAELRLGDGVKPTLPYTNGNAIVKVQFVGSGAGADCRKVGSTYTVSNLVPNDNNVLNVVATPKEVSTALTGIASSQPISATFKITMVVS